MISRKYFSIDFIFLYISILLIAWMLGSYYVDKQIDNSYATTIRVRPGFEERQYTSNLMIGKEISSSSLFDVYKSSYDLKNDFQSKKIDVVDYPFFLLKDSNKRTFLYFILKGDQTSNDISHFNIDISGGTNSFSLSYLPNKSAFNEFRWLPTLNEQSKVANDLFKTLDESSMSYNKDHLFFEIRSPWYVIPFMMHNGVFADLDIHGLLQ